MSENAAPSHTSYPKPSAVLGSNRLGLTNLVLSCIFLVITAFTLGVRLWARRIQGVKLCFNDWAALSAWPLAAGLTITSIIATVVGGSGQHIQYVDPKHLPGILKCYVAADILWILANTAIKLSILHFYIHIFGIRATFKKVVYVVMGLVVAFAIGVILTAFLVCRPFAKYWHPSLPGTCGSTIGSVLPNACVNLVIDVIIVFLPMPMIWRLHMATRRKIAVSILFALGLVVCVITSLRIMFAVRLDEKDFTYDIMRIAIVTALEPLLSTMAACLPLFPPVFQRVARSHKQSDFEPGQGYSASVLRYRTKRTNEKGYRKYDDSYLLTSLEGQGTKTQITSSAY